MAKKKRNNDDDIVKGDWKEVRDDDPVEDDERRRYYGLTSLGRGVAAAEAHRMETLVRSAYSKALIEGTEAG